MHECPMQDCKSRVVVGEQSQMDDEHDKGNGMVCDCNDDHNMNTGSGKSCNN